MKYVSFDVQFNPKKDSHAKRFVVPFPEDVVHAVFAEYFMQAIVFQWPGAKVTVHAAGTMEVYAVSTSGKSDSLKKEADDNDVRMFNGADYSLNLLP